MELMLGGALIALSALLANVAEGANKNIDRNEPKLIARQYKFVIGFGCVLFFLGVLGVLLGTYSYEIEPRERVLIAALLLGVNIQCRLILFGEKNNAKEVRAHPEPSNLLKVISAAASIGFFPRGNTGVGKLLSLSQVGFALLIASIFLI